MTITLNEEQLKRLFNYINTLPYVHAAPLVNFFQEVKKDSEKSKEEVTPKAEGESPFADAKRAAIKYIDAAKNPPKTKSKKQ